MGSIVAAGIRFCDLVLSVIGADMVAFLMRGITRQQRLLGPRAMKTSLRQQKVFRDDSFRPGTMAKRSGKGHSQAMREQWVFDQPGEGRRYRPKFFKLLPQGTTHSRKTEA